MEAQDVDIFDITDPKHPVQIIDLDLNQYKVDQPEIGVVESFLPDMVVKNRDARAPARCSQVPRVSAGPIPTRHATPVPKSLQ